jgi:uncharacterized membrane protein YtjA (UPF0391 family)
MREIVYGLVVGMIAAVIAAIVTGSAGVAVLVFMVLIVLGLLFLYATQDRIPASYLPGLEVVWHRHGWKPRKVKIHRVERAYDAGELEYAFVELDDGEVKTASMADLDIPLWTRLKYSWQRA